MRLYRKEKNWSNYWEVHINFPWVGRKKKLGWHPDFDTPNYGYGFSFPTKCFLHKEDDNYWWFTLQFLGFGITITRQNGY
jgi:hypothetical protein